MSDPAHPPATGGKGSYKFIGMGLGALLLLYLAGYAINFFLASVSDGVRNAFSARNAWDWIIWGSFITLCGFVLIRWMMSKKD